MMSEVKYVGSYASRLKPSNYPKNAKSPSKDNWVEPAIQDDTPQ
jgi:hypothetical protein